MAVPTPLAPTTASVLLGTSWDLMDMAVKVHAWSLRDQPTLRDHGNLLLVYS